MGGRRSRQRLVVLNAYAELNRNFLFGLPASMSVPQAGYPEAIEAHLFFRDAWMRSGRRSTRQFNQDSHFGLPDNTEYTPDRVPLGRSSPVPRLGRPNCPPRVSPGPAWVCGNTQAPPSRSEFSHPRSWASPRQSPRACWTHSEHAVTMPPTAHVAPHKRTTATGQGGEYRAARPGP